MLAHKVQHLLGARLHPGVPFRRAARMQQGHGLARQETIVHEEGLFDCQARVAALQFAGAIVLNACARIRSCARAGARIGSAWTKPRRAMARGRLVGLKRLRAIA